MTVTEFRQLKKLMMLSTSDNDAEALASLRKATALLLTHGHTWEQCLDRVVKVINEVEDGAGYGSGEISRQPAPRRTDDEDAEMDRLFEDALDGAAGSFRDTLLDMQAQWERQRWLSARQRQVVRDAAERAADRHPGGRVR